MRGSGVGRGHVSHIIETDNVRTAIAGGSDRDARDQSARVGEPHKGDAPGQNTEIRQGNALRTAVTERHCEPAQLKPGKEPAERLYRIKEGEGGGSAEHAQELVAASR